MAKYVDLPNLKENLTNFLNKKINPIYAKKTEIPSNISELNNDKRYQTAEEVGQAVTDGVAKIVAGAPEDFDTLKEMSDWISSHETSAAAMNSAISDNSVAIANHTSNSDIHVTKVEKTKWNKLDSDLKDGTIIVAEATKATQDAQGNVIDTTYAKKTEIPQGTVVDDALSSTSTNPVQNKVVKAEFDKLNSNLSQLELSDVAGGKNLFNPKCLLNATYDENTDTITVSNNTDKALDIVFKENTQYTFSAYVKQSDSNTGIRFNIIYTDGTISDDFLLSYLTTETYISATSKSGKTISEVKWTWGSGGTATFRHLQIEEGTQATPYEPYIPSVKMLAEEVSAQNESLSVVGKCKNLLNPTLQTTTINGVTCTNNGDGTYTLNGTAISKAVFYLNDANEKIQNYVGKKLRLVGSPKGSGYMTYGVTAYIAPKTGGEIYCNDYGEGKTFTVTDNMKSVVLYIEVYEGQSLENLVFKPMLTTNLNATYDDFVPYTGDGETLTHDVAKLKNDLSGKMNCTNPTGTGSFSLNRAPGSTIGTNSHAEGEFPVASGNNSHAEGTGTEASGEGSHAEGQFTIASGNGSHAEGTGAIASGEGSHAEGHNAEAKNEASHAEGSSTVASGMSSHAEGFITTASGTYSHAEGCKTTASGKCSHSEGFTTIAAGNYQHTEGKYNIEDTEEKYAHIIGGGTDDTERKNIHTVDWNGNAEYAGDVKSTNSYGNIISLNSLGTVEKTTLTTTSGTATLYKLGKMRHLVLNNATFSSTSVLTSTDASVGTLYFRAEVLFNSGDDLEGGSASFEDICISSSNMWNATRTATGASPVAVKGATGSATWIVQ